MESVRKPQEPVGDWSDTHHVSESHTTISDTFTINSKYPHPRRVFTIHLKEDANN